VDRFQVEGLTCQNCVRNATQALLAVPGVAHAEVELAAGLATVQWQVGAVPQPAGAVTALGQVGFRARLLVDDQVAAAANPWLPALRLGLPVAGLLLLADWVLGLGMDRRFHWVAFALALPVQVWLGGQFYRGAWSQLKVGRANMDTLVALGSTAAFGYSVVALFAGLPGHLFFTEAVTIQTLVSLGHFLEARMSARAGSAVRALLDLTPPTARRLAPDGTESEVPVRELRAGETVVLRPGDRVPVDARVLDGESAVDESLLTGEAVPVDKAPGDALLAGTVNQSGRLLAKVEATGSATALAQIIRVVQRAQGTRASVQRLADQVSAVFVPIVVAIAVGSAAWWILAPASAHAVHDSLARWLWHAHVPDSPWAAGVLIACAVLIVACPCAMGLATPVALMAGVNAAARRGILIRDAQALESCGRLDTVVFDKTGTLTVGHPAVVAEEDYRPATARVVPLAEITASFARRSQHPLSRALATLAPGSLPVENWQEQRGAGVAGQWWGHQVQVGSVARFRTAGVDLTAAATFLEAWLAQGATPALVVGDGQLWGAYALHDQLRPGAADLVKQLTADGLTVYLLTGDHPRAGAAAAAAVGIAAERVFAEVRPEAKVDHLRRLQAQGRRVAFVGDGINDGPALAAADLGIAVARAADVAREAAGLVLLRADLAAIPEALDLARRTLRTIRQNLFWAFFYNAAAVPLAALGFISPVVCALTMGLSDVLVIGNALRLRARLRGGAPGVASPVSGTATPATSATPH
jgi:Cu+-exporting ATPase